jgi:hypothetical protein
VGEGSGSLGALIFGEWERRGREGGREIRERDRREECGTTDSTSKLLPFDTTRTRCW